MDGTSRRGERRVVSFFIGLVLRNLAEGEFWAS